MVLSQFHGFASSRLGICLVVRGLDREGDVLSGSERRFMRCSIYTRTSVQAAVDEYLVPRKGANVVETLW
jgi:hypothetical protein